MHFVTVRLSWFTVYKYLCPDSRVLCFALLSGQIDWVSIKDSPSELELSLKIQPSILFQYPVFQWCILLLFCCTHLTLMYLIFFFSSFMNYYLFYFRCIIITLCLWSVILFIVYSEICQIFIYNAVFWAIQFRHECLPMHL